MTALESTILGFPRIGAHRELKKLVEGFWSDKISEATLLMEAKALRAKHWKVQHDAGIDLVPSGDFSFYDLVLDTAYTFGAIPARYQALPAGFTQYFAMARGLQKPASEATGNHAIDVPAMEMKKWFDTNYHYIVPELTADQSFALVADPQVVQHTREAKAQGLAPKPVLIGPVTFLLLSKPADREAIDAFQPLRFAAQLGTQYRTLVQQLADAGAQWIQVDEPCLGLDLNPEIEAAYRTAYAELTHDLPSSVRLMLTTYFERVGDRMDLIAELPVHGLHVDLVRAPRQLSEVMAHLPAQWVLSLGVVDGRNVWRTDLTAVVECIQPVVTELGCARVWVSSSCSLLHSPFSLEFETALDPEIQTWLAFAVEKLAELRFLARAATLPSLEAVSSDAMLSADLKANQVAFASRRGSNRVVDSTVQSRVRGVTPNMIRRSAAFTERYAQQVDRLQLPLFPTTTIGSFPQTREVRSARLKLKRGDLSQAEYNSFIKQETEQCIRRQEGWGLDVLVHGEFERTDMVEYFGEQLAGYIFTKNGWVSSYGTRCVKPPIIYGDVHRPQPMTVAMSAYAQSLTAKPLKGMLTGPVTCLQWSFVRDDQPRQVTATQLALAIRDEVADLEAAGITVVQIDEPAIREGLPLRRSDWDAYLQWAVDAFLLSSTGVKPTTQIHTHMCYSDFNDIFPAIQRMDADVITIENSRSDLKLLGAFAAHGYPNAAGPGLYDIHSPRVPSVQEMVDRVQALLQYLPRDRLWLNPDCGLKTRGWLEVEAALRHLTQTAARARTECLGTQAQ
ncbi:methionine-synthesizing 5- methyltetrahydropteroyltriglutamate--homocysteine methyltransferase [Dimargaris verticillata]|uniref:5-methyltetrahydropteroyltriglutamate--homocysteine S-methyltransferase n=1 Tax=Dimargaris verticillata TaxID=2761393 RepID=A0A9W8BB26_9FUNG|nr:methionine-synthesizing 5- methyltetrahydropteroyltriglutamate--homocysteine methyltransferase [Dimargaris verticillata]